MSNGDDDTIIIHKHNTDLQESWVGSDFQIIHDAAAIYGVGANLLAGMNYILHGGTAPSPSMGSGAQENFENVTQSRTWQGAASDLSALINALNAEQPTGYATWVTQFEALT